MNHEQRGLELREAARSPERVVMEAVRAVCGEDMELRAEVEGT